ncbi:hypothetical protein ADK57_13715 [Streptomyces sp. MMG1533]|nr:hypothetical protein ADK57_13715 [Streptomyces sp. MMG1533]
MFMAVVLPGEVVAAGAVEACGDAEAEEDRESPVQAVATSSRAAAGATRARARRDAGFTGSSSG